MAKIVMVWGPVLDAAEKLNSATKEFIEGWNHFCSKIDFGQSALDAEAIRFFNIVPGLLEQAHKAFNEAQKNG